MDCAQVSERVDLNAVVGAVTAALVAITAYLTYLTHRKVRKIPTDDGAM